MGPWRCPSGTQVSIAPECWRPGLVRVSPETARVGMSWPLPVKFSPAADLILLLTARGTIGNCGDFEGLVSWPKYLILSNWQCHHGYMMIYALGLVTISALDFSFYLKLEEANVTLGSAVTIGNSQALCAPIGPADVHFMRNEASTPDKPVDSTFQKPPCLYFLLAKIWKPGQESGQEPVLNL